MAIVTRLFSLHWVKQRVYSAAHWTRGNSQRPRVMGGHNSVQFSGIPQGKGPHAVGSMDFMSGPSNQGSFFRLYYPCAEAGHYEEPLWIPRKEYYLGLADTLKLNRFAVNFFLCYYFGSVKSPARWNAPFKPGEQYPLIIFSHGLGAFRTLYSAICIELASQGFVVAAVEHRDRSASATYYLQEKSPSDPGEPGGPTLEEVWLYNKILKAGEDEYPLRVQQVNQRAEECIRALDIILNFNAGKHTANLLPSDFDWNLLKDSIDVQRIAAVGHSFGAATAIKSLGRDSRFRCGVALDAWMFPLKDEIFSNIRQPVLFVNSEKFHWVNNILLMKKMESTSIERKMITIKGAVHQSFPDFTFLAGYMVGKLFKLKGDIDPYVAMDIINNVTLAFLQRHLDLHKDFNQWDALIDGKGEFVMPGTNLDLPPAESEIPQ
ncbi:hypothetical protein XENTR_v10015060 [Xenopus tropicalis]|uniref:Platelet-activating factor acetylhydrolase n=1 Tax=Xenopus tropicalis TaxID=8364 RepID=A0A8J0SNJ1_XENTR|nr:platelet-activating factor acetylhydrolase isoform X2 [Xenopus tropicalis]XP_012825922.1 platelet-activating factor acetylhydrolase isoform X2 [Xenopus tropicalis]KAE8605307.1 hypothetical protein XENTR_v10015060 [Xenopus tropicalis]|eukprot:XP_012825921.1 PREDICTED: platelet-activating factor acetylhydrolase isoform X3 [Xenopus tropicalis]